jgi:hypothetical protein
MKERWEDILEKKRKERKAKKGAKERKIRCRAEQSVLAHDKEKEKENKLPTKAQTPAPCFFLILLSIHFPFLCDGFHSVRCGARAFAEQHWAKEKT